MVWQMVWHKHICKFNHLNRYVFKWFLSFYQQIRFVIKMHVRKCTNDCLSFTFKYKKETTKFEGNVKKQTFQLKETNIFRNGKTFDRCSRDLHWLEFHSLRCRRFQYKQNFDTNASGPNQEPREAHRWFGQQVGKNRSGSHHIKSTSRRTFGKNKINSTH